MVSSLKKGGGLTLAQIPKNGTNTDTIRTTHTCINVVGKNTGHILHDGGGIENISKKKRCQEHHRNPQIQAAQR